MSAPYSTQYLNYGGVTDLSSKLKSLKKKRIRNFDPIFISSCECLDKVYVLLMYYYWCFSCICDRKRICLM